MNEAFLKAYERELSLLYERGKEFAEEYPGIASRLGGLLQGNLDPAVDGLMQGTAFLAARVQLQIDNEFETFTRELLDQLLPNFQAPTPSAVLVRATPDLGKPTFAEGLSFPPGSYLDARYVERDQRIQCRFRLSAPLTIWPLKIAEAAYFTGPGRFQAQGLDPLAETNAGLQIDFERVSPATGKAQPLGSLPMDRLDVHLTTLERSDAAALYEAIFAHRVRASIRFEDEHGDPVILQLSPGQIEPVGLEDDEAFFAEDTRLFRGFTLIREFFMFPAKFFGFRLTGLRPYLARNKTAKMRLLIELGTPNPALAPRVKASDFSLFCVPAVNLFEESANQIPLDVRKNEYLVVPSGSPSQNYEVHRITEVNAIYDDATGKVPVNRLYGAPPETGNPREALYYTIRRRDRVLSAREKRSGRRDYRGTETLLSFFEPGGLDSTDRATRLQVRTLSSNRHLPVYLPVGQSEADFYLNDDTSINFTRVAGPSAPRPSIAEAPVGDHVDTPVPWRLISFLTLNFLGLDNRSSGGGARSLRELLSIFVDLDSPVNAQQLQGIEKIETRAIMRSILRGNRFHPTRGIEITVTFDERAFESDSVVIFGTILDRFFAEYAPVNSFTQLVVATKQRGKLMTGAPRSGTGPLL